MTLGEKLKRARRAAGLSQEQLGAQIGVSRSAIAKWESEKGLPDIENLKGIAQRLNVSIDVLLDAKSELEFSVFREPVDLSNYGKGRKKVRKDKAVREKYPDAEIQTLIARERLTKGEKAVDTAIWLLSPLAPGTLDIAKGLNHLDEEFYLVEQGGRQYLVVVTSEYMESRLLSQPFTEEKFEFGGFQFTKCGPIKYA